MCFVVCDNSINETYFAVVEDIKKQIKGKIRIIYVEVALQGL